jgi:hypothetical protein
MKNQSRQLQKHISKFSFVSLVAVISVFNGQYSLVYAGNIQPIDNAITTPGGTVEPIPVNLDKRTIEPISKNFICSDPSQLLVPCPTFIDIVFTVRNSDQNTNTRNVNRYSISEEVFNGTSKIWKDFHFEVGYGIDSEFKNSNQFGNDFLDIGFTLPGGTTTPSSNKFETFMFGNQGNSLWFFNGEVPPPSFPLNPDVKFNYSIDIPDFNNAIPEANQIIDENKQVVGYKFTLRQIPTLEGKSVPEPTSILNLLSLGTLGIGSSLLRKKQKSEEN